MSAFEVELPEDVRAGQNVHMRLVGYSDPRQSSPMPIKFRVAYGPPGLDDLDDFEEGGSFVTDLYDGPNLTEGSGLTAPDSYDIEAGIHNPAGPVEWVFDHTTSELAMNTVPSGYSIYVENSATGGGDGSFAVVRGLWWIYDGAPVVPLSNIVVGVRAARAHFAG